MRLQPGLQILLTTILLGSGCLMDDDLDVDDEFRAAPFVLTPPVYQIGGTGASRLGGGGFKPAGVIQYEDQYVHVYLQAAALLQSSSEHIAISTFAAVEPFKGNGQWNAPNSPGGGIGIALGRIDLCTGDSSRVSFALERFAWGNPLASTILDCDTVSKATIANINKLQVTVYTSCAGTCSSYAELVNAANHQVLATVGDDGIVLANPTSTRRAWYAVTNFADERNQNNQPIQHSATVWVNNDAYFAHK